MSLLREPEDRRVHEDVLAAGELVVEARAELEQRGHAAARDDLAVVSAAGCRRRTSAASTCREPLWPRIPTVEPSSTSKSMSSSAMKARTGSARSGSPAPSTTSSARGRAGSASRRADLDRGGHLRAPRRSSPRSGRTRAIAIASTISAERERVPEVREVAPVRPVRQELRDRRLAVSDRRVVELGVDRALEDQHDRRDRVGSHDDFANQPPRVGRSVMNP